MLRMIFASSSVAAPETLRSSQFLACMVGPASERARAWGGGEFKACGQVREPG